MNKVYNSYAGAGVVKVDAIAADAVLARTTRAKMDGTIMLGTCHVESEAREGKFNIAVAPGYL